MYSHSPKVCRFYIHDIVVHFCFAIILLCFFLLSLCLLYCICCPLTGRTLTIEREVNLNKLFHWDPSPGMRKHLNIQYLTKGFTGKHHLSQLLFSIELVVSSLF